MSLRYLLLAAMVLAAPYAASAEEPICTDRPAKANAICTVPAGYYQLESSLAGWSVTEVGGVRAEYLAIAPAVVKIGLSNRSDLQVAFTPHARLRVRAGGETNRTSGFGDIVVRYKHRFSRAGAPVQMALIPFVKLPAASRGLGNDKVEGGVALPIGFSLGRSVTAVLGPEVDLLTDGVGDGYHLGVVNLINVSAPLAPRVTIAGELWSNFNFDPAGTIGQASADAAIAFLATNTLQLDAGVNFGLSRDTPEVEFYAGTSIRF